MKQLPKPGEIYRHFKGNCYRIITTATHTETGEKLVIYQALYGDYGIYARELDMFIEPVDRDKYPDAKQRMRFELLPSGAARPVVPREGAAARQTVPPTGQAAARQTASGQATARQAAPGQSTPIRQTVSGQSTQTKPAASVESAAVRQTASGQSTPVRQTTSEQTELSDKKQPPEKEAEPKVDPMVLAFLDAPTCKEKLQILTGMRERLTDAMINTMAIASDVEVKSGDITERYEELKYCLATKERFEGRRLR